MPKLVEEMQAALQTVKSIEQQIDELERELEDRERRRGAPQQVVALRLKAVGRA